MKALAHLLRHEPGRYGVVLDAGGYGDVDAVAAALGLDRAALLDVVARDPKGRFVVTGSRIRAAQGHSFPVDLGLGPSTPPATLFHGTHAGAVAAILAEGLRPMGRAAVHLSEDEATARVVGARRGRPVIVQIDAAGLHAAGAVFVRAENGVWLVDAVPPAWLRVS